MFVTHGRRSAKPLMRDACSRAVRGGLRHDGRTAHRRHAHTHDLFEVDEIPLWRDSDRPVVHAPAGGDYDPELFVVCKDPAGERPEAPGRFGTGPDDGEMPSKYRCFIVQLAFRIETAGEYTIGAY